MSEKEINETVHAMHQAVSNVSSSASLANQFLVDADIIKLTTEESESLHNCKIAPQDGTYTVSRIFTKNGYLLIFVDHVLVEVLGYVEAYSHSKSDHNPGMLEVVGPEGEELFNLNDPNIYYYSQDLKFEHAHIMTIEDFNVSGYLERF